MDRRHKSCTVRLSISVLIKKIPSGSSTYINSGHVDGIVGNTDNRSKDHGRNPMNRRTLNRPCEPNEANGKARCGIQQEPQPRLILRPLIIRLGVPLLDVPLNGRDEDKPSNHIPKANGDKGKTNLHSGKVPLLVYEGKGLDKHEDEGVGETGEQGEDEDDGLGEEHAEGTDPGRDDLLAREAIAEGDELVRTPDVGLGVLLAAALGDAVHHDGAARLGHGEEVHDLDEATEDKLDPDRPPKFQLLA